MKARTLLAVALWLVAFPDVHSADSCLPSITATVQGTGPGHQTSPIDPPQPSLPDFITSRVWLTTPWGLETYRYGWHERIQMHAQFENTGEGTCTGTIEVHFYLSKGYREDSHTDWRRVGTDFIQCDNLKPGQTHSEEEGLDVWVEIPEPGIWNVVAYVDHLQDDHNGGGAFAEKHKSNNGSTAAVFEVTGDGSAVNVPPPPPPPPQPNLVPHDLRSADVYQGDPATVWYWIGNRGMANAPETFSSVEVFSNGAWMALIPPNRVRPEHATIGYDHGETVVTSPITLSPGIYPIRLTADVSNFAQESDEGDNTVQATLRVYSRPKPVLSVASVVFTDGNGRPMSSVKRGKPTHPQAVICNSGQIAPLGTTTIGYAWSTGGSTPPLQFSPMNEDDHISPSALNPGQCSTQRIGNDHMHFPGSYTGPGWVQVCIRDTGICGVAVIPVTK